MICKFKLSFVCYNSEKDDDDEEEEYYEDDIKRWVGDEDDEKEVAMVK